MHRPAGADANGKMETFAWKAEAFTDRLIPFYSPWMVCQCSQSRIKRCPKFPAGFVFSRASHAPAKTAPLNRASRYKKAAEKVFATADIVDEVEEIASKVCSLEFVSSSLFELCCLDRDASADCQIILREFSAVLSFQPLLSGFLLKISLIGYAARANDDASSIFLGSTTRHASPPPFFYVFAT